MWRHVRYLVLATAATFLVGCSDSKPEFVPASPEVMEAAGASRSPAGGKAAPDFTLMAENGRNVTLSSLRGKWIVLYFYPKDDTPGCACQASEFTKTITEFHHMNAEVFGISTDSPESHQFFIKKYDLKLTLLSDPDHRVMQKYGAWVEAEVGTTPYGRVIRSTMIIDPRGTIAYHWPEVIPQGHAERVRQKLSELQASYR